MELRELKSFTTAAKLRSISKAAGVLGIGQPTATTHIKKLEKEVGTELFDRMTRPITLTLTGSILAELATPLVEGLDELVATTLQSEEQGPVTIASSADMVPHTLLRVIRVFRHRYPHTRVRVRSGIRADVLEAVAAGEVDFGLLGDPVRDPDFEFEGLFPFERVLITPLGHPLLDYPLESLDQLAEWPLILMAKPSYTRSMLESEFRRRGQHYEVVVELDSIATIKRYVALGMGISVGPRLAIEPDDEKELGIISLANYLPVEQAGIVTLKGRALSTPTLEFLAVMRDTVSSFRA